MTFKILRLSYVLYRLVKLKHWRSLFCVCIWKYASIHRVNEFFQDSRLIKTFENFILNHVQSDSNLYKTIFTDFISRFSGEACFCFSMPKLFFFISLNRNYFFIFLRFVNWIKSWPKIVTFRELKNPRKSLSILYKLETALYLHNITNDYNDY